MSSPSPQCWLQDHGSALYAFAMLHLHDTHRAEDMVQETLLAALQGWERFRGECGLRTWLIGILKHKILDEFRRRQREGEEVVVDGDDDFLDDGHWRELSSDWGDPERCLHGQQFWALIERCIAAMPEGAGRLFLLRELWEWDTETACRELNISPSNLWTGLHRARLKMRRCLQRSAGYTRAVEEP